MCGIIGCIGTKEASSITRLGLAMLQHRGQDSAGIYTANGNLHKQMGLVVDVFKPKEIARLRGEAAIGQVRYATIGNDQDLKSAQPFEIKVPHNMGLVHNGNIVNTDELKAILKTKDNILSDSELLLHLFAHYLKDRPIKSENLFKVVEKINSVVVGSYSVIMLFPKFGLLAFRDKRGVRPISMGKKAGEYLFASESRVFNTLGFEFLRDVEPGESIFITSDGKMKSKICAKEPSLNPCLFEFLYIAMPDSIVSGVSVYDFRVDIGIECAKHVKSSFEQIPYDLIVPVPHTGKAIGLGVAEELGLPYHDILIRNKHVNRTFIMPDEKTRQTALWQKFGLVASRVKGKKICLVDDSIVRGNTTKSLSKYFRQMGAKEVHYVIASPEIRHTNVYGIYIPTQKELVAHKRNAKQIAEVINADSVTFLPLQKVHSVLNRHNPNLTSFEESMFTNQHLSWIKTTRT